MIGSHKGAVNIQRHRICRSVKWVLAVLIAAFVFTVVIASFLASTGEAVVGPEGSYTEANGDVIEICADAACTNHTNTFSKGAVVYVKVTTTRVPNNLGFGGRVRLRNYLNTQVGTIATWTQTSAVSPYVYTSAVTIPAGSTNYLKVAASVVSNTGSRVTYEEALDIAAINQFIHFYSDASRTDESYTFRPGATMYVRAYGNGNAYSSSRTGTNNRMFDFTNATKATWAVPAVTKVGNNYDFPLTLPASGLVDGNWYWVRTLLRNSSFGTIERMSRMVQIDATNPTASISSPGANAYLADSIPVNGTATDATSFYNYIMEYGAGASPSSWTQVGATSYSPVSAGLLQNWDTAIVSDGLYTLRLTVTDRAYNTGAASVQVNVDNTPPVISAVQAGPLTSNSATVTWTTDEVTDSQVEYGTSPGVYSDATTLDPALVTSHSQALANLQSSTDYYYRVRSTDRTGHTTYSTEYGFRTANITVLQPYAAIGRDTTIESYQPAWNRGAAIWLVAGDFSISDWGTARSLLRYDLSWIPPSATIQSANMSLYQMSQGSTGAVTLDVHEVTVHDWTEGTGTGSATGDGATWATGALPWSAAGGDFNPAPAGSAIAPNSTAAWVNWDIRALAQSWVSGTPNYGVIVKQNAENPVVDDYKTYYSSDYLENRSLRPKLVIEWFGSEATPPNIGEIRAEGITRTSASIKWSTDEGANYQVEYGTTTSYGSSTALDPAILNQHTVLLPGLTEDTVYHYRVKSTDSLGNQSISGDSVFQTARLITIQPDTTAGNDTWISSSGTANNYGSSSDINAGNNAASAENLRGLLKFNLVSIPTGSTINSATVSLYQYAQADISTPLFGVYYIAGAWTGGTGNGTASGDGATWATSNGSSSWISPGGDFNGSSAGAATAPNSTAAWVDFSVPGLVQDWVNGTVINNGAVIRKTTENAGVTDYKSYYSSDYSTDPSLRPKLVVEYVPAPGSITITVNETYNRNGSPGSGSVGFGNVSPGTTYYVGDSASPQYATKLTIKSNSKWGLKVASAADLEQTNPANYIYISNLAWKQDTDGPGAWQAMVKSPDATVISTGQVATNGTSFFFDYRLMLPNMAVSGSYLVPLVYTAYSE